MSESIICAHRGLDDSAPENTLAAFGAALKRGMAIEFDVQMTIDGSAVVMHDWTVDRTTDGSGSVSQLTLAEVKALDAGSWYGPEFAGLRVPTLNETLDLVRSRAQVSPSMAIDLKTIQPGMTDLICAGLQRYGLIIDAVGIGAIIRSAEIREAFQEFSNDFPSAAVAETLDDVDEALSDPYSKWVYARFVPKPEDVQRVHAGGKPAA